MVRLVTKLYNNQLGVNIHSPKNVDDPFFKENVDVCFAAMRDLGGNAYMLWQYLASNRDGYTIGLSFADVSNVIGLGRAAYTTAKDTLISKGYLVPIEGTAWYDFYRTPNLMLIASRRSYADSQEKISSLNKSYADSHDKIAQSYADSQHNLVQENSSYADSHDNLVEEIPSSPDSHDKIVESNSSYADSHDKIYHASVEENSSYADSRDNFMLIANKSYADSHERNTIIHINTINNIEDFKGHTFVHRDDPTMTATGQELLNVCQGNPENLAQVYECYPDTRQYVEYFADVDWSDYKW